MATVTKDGSGTWLVRWSEYDKDGKRVQRKKSFKRAADANEYKRLVENSEIVERSAECDFAACADSWWAIHKTKLEVSTIDGYIRILDRAKTYFGKMSLAKIKPSTINQFYAALMSDNNGLTKKPLSEVSLGRYHAVLQLIFKNALWDNSIKVNPMDRVKLPKSPDHETSLPDIEYVKARLNDLRNSPYFVGACIAFFAGLRRSEVLGLKWQDIDLARKSLAVHRVRQRAPHVDGIKLNAYTHHINIPGMDDWIERDCTKSKHDRATLIPNELVRILKSEKEQQKVNRVRIGSSYIVSDYVCVYDDGKPISENGLSKSMSGVCRLHDLRHMNITYLLDAGIPIPEVARRAGHTTPQTTMKVYAHALDKQDQESVIALENVIGKLR